jgi:hypothetical protein
MSSRSRMAHHPDWEITSYFHPENYNNRRLNYHRFRSALRVPLITVELSAGSLRSPAHRVTNRPIRDQVDSKITDMFSQ